jgi:hypothetical protein
MRLLADCRGNRGTVNSVPVEQCTSRTAEQRHTTNTTGAISWTFFPLAVCSVDRVRYCGKWLGLKRAPQTRYFLLFPYFPKLPIFYFYPINFPILVHCYVCPISWTLNTIIIVLVYTLYFFDPVFLAD